jgi:hypothetical protein
VQVSDLDVTVVFGAFFWPILIALDATFLFYIRYHHDNAAVLFPNHAPKVAKRVGHGPLCGYIGVLFLIALFLKF